MKDVKSVVAQLLKEGAKIHKNLKIVNVNTEKKEKYTRVSLTLRTSVPQYVEGKDGVWAVGENNVIFVSAFSIAAVLGSMEETAFAKNVILANPRILEMLLSYADIDILLEEVVEGQEYTNPFSNKGVEHIVAHSSLYPHVVSLNIGNIGKEFLQDLKKEMIKINIKKALGIAKDDNADSNKSAIAEL